MRFEANTFAALFSEGEERSAIDTGASLQAVTALAPAAISAPRVRALPEILQALRAGRLLRLRSGDRALYAPETRLVCHPAQVDVPERISRLQQRQDFDLVFDEDFASVWAHRPSLTGMRLAPLSALRTSLEALAAAGHGHHFMLRDARKRCLASGFGVEIGKAFTVVFVKGRHDDLVQTGLILLARHLAHWGYGSFEASAAGHLARDLGFADMPPGTYQAHCSRQHPPWAPAPWHVLPELCSLIEPHADPVHEDDYPRTTREALLAALSITPPAPAAPRAASDMKTPWAA
ncbi:MAG: hypothetical protein KGQ37_11000 [Hyphomicrobiales bacterium]|nr:hypothetical protein [Hyphomicrobiales bacterium]